MYYDILKIFQNLSRKMPANVENLLSIPIWYNADLNTKFDVELSRAGFNFMKDLFPNTELISMNDQMITQLRPVKRRYLIQIILKIPGWLGNAIEDSPIINVTVSPSQTVHINKSDVTIQSLNSGTVYSTLIEEKTRLPTGLLHWCEEFQLSNEEIKTAFTFARDCCSQTFDRVFQFKIVTRILPTNQYLTRYRVKESEICSRCLVEIDTVLHSTWSCDQIVPLISCVIVFLTTKCTVGVDINLRKYLFGFQGNNFLGLNQFLLELKKILFINFEENVRLNNYLKGSKGELCILLLKKK